MKVIGVTEATYSYTKSYLTYITMGAPFIMLANCCANMLRGEGAATASMIGNMTGTIVMNNTMGKYGEAPLAAMNVAMKINMLVVFMQTGLCMGVMPLVGYNYGAGNKKRMKNIIYFTGICTVCVGTLLTLVMVFSRSSIVAAFIDDPAVISYGIRYLVAIQLSGPFVGLFFLSTSTLQGMGKATYSLLLTVLRQGVAYVPAILLLDHFAGLSGLCYAQPIADYFSIVLGLIIATTAVRKFQPKEEPAPTVRQKRNHEHHERHYGNTLQPQPVRSANRPSGRR